MIKRSIAAATLTLGLATVAHANLTAGRPADLASPLGTQPLAGVQRAAPSVVYAANDALAPKTRNDADDRPQIARPAPRVVELPGAGAPSQGYTALPPTTATVNQPEYQSRTRPASSAREPGPSEVAAATHQAVEGGRGVAKAPLRPANADRPAGYRAVKWSGGDGATWKSGRDAYGFSGTFGGCRITGATGPHGYRLDHAC